MATILRQTLQTAASKAISSSLKVSAVGVQKVKITSEVAARGLTLNTLSRGLHCIAASNGSISRLHEQRSLCSHRKFHTKGDESMAEFLDREITHEKDNAPPKTSAISGWTTTTDGTLVKLTKTFKDESICVEFDVTSSVEGDMDEQMYNAESQEDTQAMVSRPPFTVELKKASGKCLKMECEFTPPEPQFEEGQSPETKEENIEDQFSIIEVNITEPGQTENFFTLSGGIMDEVMYDLLMEMLDERGIDDDFVTAMVKFSTSYEQSLYVKFLQSLKTFVGEK